MNPKKVEETITHNMSKEMLITIDQLRSFQVLINKFFSDLERKVLLDFLIEVEKK